MTLQHAVHPRQLMTQRSLKFRADRAANHIGSRRSALYYFLALFAQITEDCAILLID